jgi:hypothetical protein
MGGGATILLGGEVSDPVLTRLVEEDKVPWYKKKNLRYLYMVLIPTCMGVEMTSGYVYVLRPKLARS